MISIKNNNKTKEGTKMIYPIGSMITASKNDKRRGLTKGKQYKVTSCSPSVVGVINDNGHKRGGIGYDLIEPFRAKGRGRLTVTVTTGHKTPNVVAIITDTFRPIPGQALVINGIALEVRIMVSDIMGNSVISVKAAKHIAVARAKLL